MVSSDLLSLAFWLGSKSAAEAAHDPALKHAAGLATVADGWRAYRRDAGAGDVGPAHQISRDGDAVQITDDPRRDAVLLWLVDAADRSIASSARTLATMVGAKRRFEAVELSLLDVALEAIGHGDRDCGPIALALGLAAIGGDHPLAAIRPVIGAIDLLSNDAAFVEGHGQETELHLPRGTLRHYIAADPAGTWALNLALLARPPRGMPALAGVIPRGVFRLDLEPQERSAMLIQQWAAVAESSVRDEKSLSGRLRRGGEALGGLSRNARASDAWALIAALGPLSRAQIVRALALSRAGGDIQARALADAGLVTLERGVPIRPEIRKRLAPAPQPLNHGPLSKAVAALDESMAAIDLLLTQTAGGREGIANEIGSLGAVEETDDGYPP